MKFLVTSRPYFSIEMEFARWTGNFPIIRLTGEDETKHIRKEIDLVIVKEVKSLSRELCLESQDAFLLRNKLLKVKHRTYLWLKLTFDLIRADFKSLTRKRKQEVILHSISDSVDAAYTTILNKSTNKLRAQRLLSIICAAIRPLSVREMGVTLAIEPQNRVLEDLELESEARTKILIRNLCGLFVRIIGERVYLLHQTAKEFLTAHPNAIQSASSLSSIRP